MQLTAFGFSPREDNVRRRFGQLSRLLEDIQSDISRQCTELRSSSLRKTDSAAFAFQAMDNGEDMSARIESLTRDLADYRRQQASLEQQKSFVADLRFGLEDFLTRHDPFC